MAILHLVNRWHGLGDALSVIVPGDTIVLCGDAVTGWQQDWPWQTNVCVMEEDIRARALEMPDTIRCIDYPQLVALCCEHARVIAW